MCVCVEITKKSNGHEKIIIRCVYKNRFGIVFMLRFLLGETISANETKREKEKTKSKTET